jgi:osmoprotectant transport system substrate-binding protein
MSTRRTIPALAAVLALAFGVAACGSDNNDNGGGSSPAGGTTENAEPAAIIKHNDANAKTTINVGSKNFTEQKVLGEIYAQAFEAAGYNVKKSLNLGDQTTALKAVKTGQISGYPEYTGTALLSFLKVPVKDLTHDPNEAYDQVKAGMAKQGIVAFPPTPFTSSNEVGLLKKKAQELGVTKISDLKSKAGTLTLYGSPECRTRLDCLLGLEQVYGLKFKKVVPVDPSLRYSVLTSKKAQVGIVFTTDGQLAQGKVSLIQDDKHLFPPYNVTLVFRKATLDKLGPDAQKTVALVQKGLTTEAMQELNSRVDIDKQTPAAVAKEYLKESGYIK